MRTTKSAVRLALCAAIILPTLCAGASRWQQSEKLGVRGIEVLTSDPACWKRVDLRVALTATYTTPFDPDEVAVDAVFTKPSGKLLTVPAFFYQPFEREVKQKTPSTTEEVMHEAGKGEWRIRFTPTEPGRYTVQVSVRDRSGTAKSALAKFTARPGSGHGFVRVSRKDHRYFEFQDGTPYFALGENMAGGPQSEFYRWIPQLARNGGNFGRIWIGNDQFGIERAAMGEYRLDSAWRFDQILELSEANGVYQKLCIESVRNITPKGEERKSFDPEDFAYSVSNGGPCKDMKDFFVLPEAKRRFKARLRYLVARWGYSPNVFAWELWNEFETVGARPDKEKTIIPWSVEMCGYLQSIDPWRHMTTNSLGSHALLPALWESKEHDFTQMHGYYGWHKPEDEELARAMVPLMVKWLDKLTVFHKPYLWAEFGVARGKTPELRELGDRDQDGVNMHAGLWTPVMHGAAGSGHIWWWGAYVDRKDLYYHFRGLANFVKGIQWTTAGFEKAKVETHNDRLGVMGLHGKSLSILWVMNKDYTWWNVIQKTPVSAVESTSFEVSGFQAGAYKVEYWDTYEGRIIRTAPANSTAGKLKIAVPKLDRDIAIKIIPAATAR